MVLLPIGFLRILPHVNSFLCFGQALCCFFGGHLFINTKTKGLGNLMATRFLRRSDGGLQPFALEAISVTKKRKHVRQHVTSFDLVPVEGIVRLARFDLIGMNLNPAIF